VRVGQADTGRVITSAAMIMVLVFGSFLLQGQRVISEFGIGLAGAVLLDAFVLRTVLVPALMHLFGKANWWLPKGLDRVLPHVSVDPSEAEISRRRGRKLDQLVAQPDINRSGPASGRGRRRSEVSDPCTT
jgi:RND superfamily putative drug exporter